MAITKPDTVFIEGNLIVFPIFHYSYHGQLQEWINVTDNNDKYKVILTEASASSSATRLVCAIEPTEKYMFYWKLNGPEELLQEIIDFRAKHKYNT